MSHALVVYESMFGNTHQVAEAIARGLVTAGHPAEVVEVGDAPDRVPEDVDLLVVGGPTHAFGMSWPTTRGSAAQQGADREAAQRRGIREWLRQLHGPRGLKAAAFDTRVQTPRLAGSAASAARRRLRKEGLHVVAEPEDFYVTDTSGPLVDGELARAEQWGRRLAAA